jgi:hypothetical protein
MFALNQLMQRHENNNVAQRSRLCNPSGIDHSHTCDGAMDGMFGGFSISCNFEVAQTPLVLEYTATYISFLRTSILQLHLVD